MNVYLVLDGSRVVGVSARLQGAEVIRADEARRHRSYWLEHGKRPQEQAATAERTAYDRMRVETHAVRDED